MPPDSPKTILLIEDTPETREILRIALESDGYSVLEAGDGHEGVRLYRMHRPALAIVDMVMPETHGSETVKEILAFDADAVIFTICGRDGSDDASKVARIIGARRVFKKPFNLAELLGQVSNALDTLPNSDARSDPSDQRLARRVFACLLERIPSTDSDVIRSMVSDIQIVPGILLDSEDPGTLACYRPAHFGDERLSNGPIQISDWFFMRADYSETWLAGLVAHEAAHAVLLRKLGPARSREADSEQLVSDLIRTWGLREEADALEADHNPGVDSDDDW